MDNKQPDTLHSWNEYFIAKKLLDDLRFQYGEVGLSGKDKEEATKLAERVILWEKEQYILENKCESAHLFYPCSNT